MLALLAALLIPTGIHMATSYDHAGVAHCLTDTRSGSCSSTIAAFTMQFDGLGSVIAWLTFVPGLIGILLAAPFVTQLEQRTYRLDWTQSITRTRWITTKLGLATATAVVSALVLTILLTWWRAPLVHVQGRMTSSVYDSEGPVVIAYTLFSLGLATAAGAVWRRTAPALVVGLIGYVAVRLFVDIWLRQRLADPATSVWRVNGQVPNLDRTWIINQYVTGPRGQRLPFVSCGHGASGACRPVGVAHGYVHAVYQPPGHFWTLQTVETAIFAGVALALLAFAGWWTRARAG